jgi:hypothetical protein
MQEALQRKTRTLMERVAEHPFAITIIIFLTVVAVIGAGSGVGVSSQVADNIRQYLSALFR